MNKEDSFSMADVGVGIAIFFGIILSIIMLIFGYSVVHHNYMVWSEGKVGEAELARAESNRQIKTLEARALMESSKHLADAEVIRAKGVAEANRIIGDSLKGNESYLRYLWITSLESKSKEIIYIPTEANLPILEAGRIK